MKNKKWTLFVCLIFILIVITFTPLVTPHGKFTPKIFGIPFTLWTGFLVTLFIVFICFIAASVHPSRQEDKISDYD